MLLVCSFALRVKLAYVSLVNVELCGLKESEVALAVMRLSNNGQRGQIKDPT
jgi:hypothetical protein